MTLTMVLMWLSRYWKVAVGGLVLVLVLGQYGCIRILKGQRDGARERLSPLEQELVLVRGQAAHCKGLLAEQNAAVERWRHSAAEQEAAVEVAKEEVERVRIVSAAKLERLETEIAELQLRLATLPEAERCEVAARWVAAKYREVSDAQ